MRITRPQRAAQWTRERIDALSTAEVRQLRDNAARLNEAEIAALCEQVLVSRPRAKKKVKLGKL
ncbi:MAG: hypothetical protein ACT4P3_17145 [Betaproteobacteria bacterium]